MYVLAVDGSGGSLMKTLLFCSVLTGGTVDVAVHEVLEDFQLKELYQASGGAWGGTTVDDAFFRFLSKLAG